MAIILTRNGKRYEITEADQIRIAELTRQHGGYLPAAIAQHWREKFGEALDLPGGEDASVKSSQLSSQ